MRRFKKLLSLVLSAALLLGCLETSVFAATADFTFDVTKIEKYSEETHDVLADEVTSVKEGDIIYCKGYERDGEYYTLTAYQQVF